MDKFSIKQLADLAGVSVRTLHHYDHIGLLKPSIRTEAGFRFYGKDELLRLQQLMLYKELDFTLSAIKEILDEKDFDLVGALKAQKTELTKRRSRLKQLIETISNTIIQIKAKNEKMNYNELYKGFPKGEEYEKEAKERWGADKVEESKQRILQMSKQEFEDLKQEGENINKELAGIMHLEVSDVKVQALVQRHINMIGKYYTVTPEIYKGLAEMYVADERFKANYEKHKAGLAEFLSKAMMYFIEGNC